MRSHDVSFTVERGECLGLVGESGSGKTTVSKAIMRAVPMDEGEILFHDRGHVTDLLKLDLRQHGADPAEDSVHLPGPLLLAQPAHDGRQHPRRAVRHPRHRHRHRRAAPPPCGCSRWSGSGAQHLNRYPHSFSGGQRQRIGIARALALQPDLIICDEPVSALDVSIQAQILNLLKDLQKEIGLTYLFISHNLAVINYIADRIAVMCAGPPRGARAARGAVPQSRPPLHARR